MQGCYTQHQLAAMCRIQQERIDVLKRSIAGEAGFVNEARKAYTQNLLDSMTATLNHYRALA